MNTKIATLSLFSGAGGLDIGFRQAGFEIKGCVEIDPVYCETLSGNAGKETAVHGQDIRSFDTRPYRNIGIECVIGGPPCQTFSAAGRRSGGVIGIEDERGQLFRAYCRVLREIQPAVFIFENVYGLPGANGGGPWRAITSEFSKLGYQLAAEVLDAADYGVPQHRERLILVGSRSGQFSFPKPTHGPDSGGGNPLTSVEETIRDLQDPDEPFHNNLGGLYGHLLPLVPEGLNYSFFTAEMGHPHPVFAWRSKFHDLLYKVSRTEPCRTIKAQPGKFTGPFHWKNRHFTTAELKRLQTFPDDYDIAGCASKVLEQIGNSVPPRLAYALAMSVRQQLLEPTSRLTFPIRPPGFRSTFRQRQRIRNKRFHEIAKKAISTLKGTVFHTNMATTDERIEFFLNPHSRFDRTRVTSLAAVDPNHPGFQVSIAENGSHIELSFDRLGEVNAGISVVQIAGLRKYLPNYNTVTMRARIREATDIFHAWGVIEDVLTRRSRFYSLIDIYGHYANRGDTVRINAKWKLPRGGLLLRAINRFGDSMECGEFLRQEELMSDLNVSDSALEKAIINMRGIRYDIRTPRTHPIISPGFLLCTYPFPLLSPRALVESRALLVPIGKDNPKAWMTAG